MQFCVRELITPALALGAVAPYRLVQLAEGPNGENAKQATDKAKVIIGASDDVGADAGGVLDVTRRGIVPVECGGDVPIESPVTTDADGRAIVAGAGDFVIGYAQESGAVGIRISVALTAGYQQGAAPA